MNPGEAEKKAPRRRPAYWRSFDEVSGNTPFDALVHREFPGEAGVMPDPVGRRNFIKVMGASVMLAGMAGCARQPEEKIVPYVKAPEEMVSGKPDYFATAMPFDGYGQGVVVTSFEGRPTKIEGLPEHPASHGATSLHAQASILDMYDPDRLNTVTYGGRISTWNRFIMDTATALARLDEKQGAGLRILTGTVTSPTLARQMKALREAYPNMRWHQHDPAGRDGMRAGAQLVFGRYVETLYDFSRVKTVLSLDADFLHQGPAHVRYARDFARTRDVEANHGAMSRLFVAEPSPTLTGAVADHKLGLRHDEVETLARVVARRLGIPGVDVDEAAAAKLPTGWLDALLKDLQGDGPGAVVIPGDGQPAAVHALAHAINARLGSMAVSHIAPVEAEPVDQAASLRALVEDMNRGDVAMLVILGGNPVYDTPWDVGFKDALERVPFRAHLTTHENETSHDCHWVIPQAHYLEAWGDVRSFNGTASIVQPLILPLYKGKAASEVLAVLLGDENPDAHAIVRETWIKHRPGDGFDRFWKNALSRGVIPGTTAKKLGIKMTLRIPPHRPVAREGLDVVFRLDPALHEGRYANNAWLQELPKPLTKLTWDNAVHIHPATARALHLDHEDLVVLSCNGRQVEAPVLYQFGHPRDAITVHLGHGREICGPVGRGVGFNAYAVRSSTSPWCATGASLAKTGKSYALARTEEHYNIEQSIVEQGETAQDRHLIREAPLAHFRERPDFAQHLGHHAPGREDTLYKPDEKSWDGYAWGMTIDLGRCTGCNVCVMACQSENNIPVVGKEQVIKGREMQWIRIDRYYKGDYGGEPEVAFQPVPCMQCENAPCEPVCPVGATMHSKEGLNDMVYNRCVGTRYCANNCPYKVRRFNFFKFADHKTPQLKMMRNPNVTVRSRGVMEKCTYCVQRINMARITAKRDGRLIQDGEVVTACQAACPSGAIQFGNLNDPGSRIAASKKSPRNYSLLADVGTRPRTTYLAKVNNPSAHLDAGGGEGGPAMPHEPQPEHG